MRAGTTHEVYVECVEPFIKGVKIRTHPDTDKFMIDCACQMIKSYQPDRIYGIGEIYAAEEINEREYLSGNFTFVLETDGYSAFSDGWVRPYVKKLNLSDYRFGKATHGHLPDKGAQPTFIACGPDIKRGVVLERRPIVDEASTYAKILGVVMPWADGTPIDEILNIG